MKKIFLLSLLMIFKMTTSNAQSDSANYSYATVPTKFVDASGIKFAYRSYGKEGDIPVIYFNHLTANLDNCDPKNNGCRCSKTPYHFF
jgi:hypothetical protein